MKDRIREIRESMRDEHGKKMTQAKFAEKIGVSVSTAQKWEIGAAIPNSTAVKQIAEKCGVSEVWLRTGIGSKDEAKGRADEMDAMVRRLMRDSSESFKAALITTLLRFDPDGPEWEVLERIYRSVSEGFNHGDK
jgi:transcriptional regulator with XRE-family HTH domain